MFLVEEELDVGSGTAAVLSNDKIGDVLALGFLVVIVFAMDEHDNICILLDGTGFAEVG